MHQTFGTLVQFGVQLYERHLFFSFYYRRIKLFLILLHDSLRNITDAIFTQHILNRLLANRAFKLFFFSDFYHSLYNVYACGRYNNSVSRLRDPFPSRLSSAYRNDRKTTYREAAIPLRMFSFPLLAFCRFIPLLAFVI